VLEQLARILVPHEHDDDAIPALDVRSDRVGLIAPANGGNLEIPITDRARR
jgi:hypothetical protein